MMKNSVFVSSMYPAALVARTLAVYRARIVPKAWVPDWIRRRAQRKTLPEMIERLRRQVR